jgi:hypothetical protein
MGRRRDGDDLIARGAARKQARIPPKCALERSPLPTHVSAFGRRVNQNPFVFDHAL